MLEAHGVYNELPGALFWFIVVLLLRLLLWMLLLPFVFVFFVVVVVVAAVVVVFVGVVYKTNVRLYAERDQMSQEQQLRYRALYAQNRLYPSFGLFCVKGYINI